MIRKKVIESGGNFDAMLGLVTHWDWKLRDDGGIDVTTKLTSHGTGLMDEEVKPAEGQKDGDREKMFEFVKALYTRIKNDYGDEYKVMGLAPYGTSKYKDIILENIIDLKKDGSFKLNQKYFNYMGGLTMTNQKFADLFDHPIRKPEIDKLTQFHMDMAASIQSVIEEVILRIVKYIRNKYKIEKQWFKKI